MKILCLCDSPTLVSGFARVATNLMKRWAAAGATIDCWGIAFQGWGYSNHPYVRTFFPAGTGQQHDHWASAERLSLFLAQLQSGGYTHVWILQDTFQLVNFKFPQKLRAVCSQRSIKSMLYFPVDAPLEPEWTDILAAVDVPVAFTEYGRAEAVQKLAVRAAATPQIEGLNYKVNIRVLPHGVDEAVYHPLAARAEIRRTFWDTEFAGPDDFLLVNVNVNQRRKDVARSLEVLQAVRELGVPAKLIMHMAAVSSDELNLEAVGRQLGLRINVDWSHHNHLFVRGQGKLTEPEVNKLYNIADLYLTTTLGEGWGLGITEALASGAPVAIPVHTSCLEIGTQLMESGMGSRWVDLPIERHCLIQGLDNSRCRRRVDVAGAAASIKAFYDSGIWKQRVELNPAVRAWLSWDRIAQEMLALYPKETLSL